MPTGIVLCKEIGKNIVVSYDEIGKLTETVQINADTYLSK